MPGVPKKWQNLILSVGMLSTGSLNTISKKIMYQTQGKNIDGEMEYYDKPWWCTLIMFLGEAVCLAAFYVQRAVSKRRSARQAAKLVEEEEDDESSQHRAPQPAARAAPARYDPTGGFGMWRFLLLSCLLCSCDLVATTLTGIALVYCSASVTQILRGFVIVFVLLFSICFLHRSPMRWQVIGVCSSVLGLIFIGIAALLGEGAGGKVLDMVLGICLALVAQVFSATQFVFEEKFMKGHDIPPLYLVGWEGIFGSILTMGVALPICYAIPGDDHGSYENFINSAYMMFNNGLLLGMQLLYFISISFFNYMSLTMSKALSATNRTLIDAMRTCVVWIVMCIVYYCTFESMGENAYGEPLSWYSLLQLAGFIFMIFGTVIHNNVNGFGAKVACYKKGDEPQPLNCCPCRDGRRSTIPLETTEDIEEEETAERQALLTAEDESNS